MWICGSFIRRCYSLFQTTYYKIPKDPKKYEQKRLGRRVTLVIKNCQAADMGEVALRIDQRDSTAQLNVKSEYQKCSPVFVPMWGM